MLWSANFLICFLASFEQIPNRSINKTATRCLCSRLSSCAFRSILGPWGKLFIWSVLYFLIPSVYFFMHIWYIFRLSPSTAAVSSVQFLLNSSVNKPCRTTMDSIQTVLFSHKIFAFVRQRYFRGRCWQVMALACYKTCTVGRQDTRNSRKSQL